MNFRRTIQVLALLVISATPCAHAFSGAGEAGLDPTVLTQMEDHARHADTREQAYLFTELLKGYSDLASREIAAGDMEKAGNTLRSIEQFSGLVHGSLAMNAKRLKDAQMLLHAAVFRLGETLRYVSAEDKTMLQGTLRQLNKLNDELLAKVFAR